MTPTEFVTWIAGICGTLFGIWFTYRGMVKSAQEKATALHTETRTAELQDQATFRSQLLQQVSDMSARITNQDSHILQISSELIEEKRLRKSTEAKLARAEEHFERCDEDLRKLKDLVGIE